MAAVPDAVPRSTRPYRVPDLLQDIRLLDLLELSGTTVQASALLNLSQPTVSRRYRLLAKDFGLQRHPRQLQGCRFELPRRCACCGWAAVPIASQPAWHESAQMSCTSRSRRKSMVFYRYQSAFAPLRHGRSWCAKEFSMAPSSPAWNFSGTTYLMHESWISSTLASCL